ncbi:MAG: hypothetical protein AAGF11_36125 [Myxococcota bacterium]
MTFNRPLCRGNIELIEQTITHVEQSLDVKVEEPEEPIEIAIWNRYANVVDHCGEGPSGCYTNGEIHTLWQALEHEIVHAVHAPLGWPEPLWSEGIAEALSGRTRDGQDDVTALVGLESYRQVDYATAGHFTRWLLEEHGIEGIRALARESSFESTYGRTLADANVDYEADAPWSYPDWNTCRGARLDATSEAEWVYEFDVDCDQPWSSAEYESGPTAWRTIDIEQSGSYRAYFTGVRMVGVLACQLDILVDPPEDDMVGDIVSETAGSVLPTFFVGDEPYDVQLEPYRLQFSITANGEASTTTFELRRIGP